MIGPLRELSLRGMPLGENEVGLMADAPLLSTLRALNIIDDAGSRRDTAFQEIDGEAATVTREREVIAGSVPADLLKLYDKLREQQGGIGAAKLYARTCQGCRQELAITELNEIRAAAPDTVVRCENCRRILVRTAESGL